MPTKKSSPKPSNPADQKTGRGCQERLVRHSWRDHEMMWVIGCIDANGAITARPSKLGRTHRPDESKGKRWRWCVWSQEMTWLVGRTVEEINNPRLRELTDEEYFTVCDWLIRHGYADESILLNDQGEAQPPAK